MVNIEELKNKRESYKVCLKRVVDTANALGKAILVLRNTISIQAECYSVDDQVGGSNFLNYLLENAEKLYYEIVNNVISALNSIINNLSVEIIYQEKLIFNGGN